MTEAIDHLIQARFDAVANTEDDRDWNDVLARARSDELTARRSARRTAFVRRVPTRLALVAAVVALAAVVTAVAFGWPQTLIDFFTSPPAPTKVKNWFGAQNVESPPGMNPQAIPGQTRKIATARFDANLPGGHPTVHTLYVAPTKSGGFCYLWTKGDGGCLPAKTPSATAWPLAVAWASANRLDYPLFVDGWVRAGATKTVEARFADGKTATIPVTWVSAPINAGFFVYPVPRAHWTHADALKSVLALDASGTALGMESAPLLSFVLPFGGIRHPPGGAAVRQKREVVSRNTDRGIGRASIWEAPDRLSPAHCAWLQVGRQVYGGNCRPDQPPPRGLSQVVPVVLHIKGKDLPILWGHVGANVAHLTLLFQDGTHARISPQNGVFLYPAPPSRWIQGHRPAFLIARDHRDHIVGKFPLY